MLGFVIKSGEGHHAAVMLGSFSMAQAFTRTSVWSLELVLWLNLLTSKSSRWEYPLATLRTHSYEATFFFNDYNTPSVSALLVSVSQSWFFRLQLSSFEELFKFPQFLGLQTLIHPWGQFTAQRRHNVTILVKTDSLAELKGAKHNSKIWNYLQQVGCQSIPERQDPLGFDYLPEAVRCS